MLSVTLAVLLAASNAKVAAVGFQAVDVDEKKATFFSDYFAEQLGAAGGFAVSTSSEISAVIGLERQKQLMGCSDATGSCMAELAGALGADAVISGSIAKLGGAYALTIRVTKTSDGKPIASASGNVDKESDVLPFLATQAKEMAPRVKRAVFGGSGGTETAENISTSAATSRGRLPRGAVFLFIGGGLLIGAGVTYAIAADDAAQIDSPTSRYTGPADAAKGAKTAGTLQTLAFIEAGAAAAAFIVGGVMMATSGGDSSVSLSPYVSDHGGGFALGGSF
ncbi:MAG: hypothetical protein ACJ790_14520 [Myxococcaceae bacterium]